MNQLTTIDSLELSTVHGGDNTTVGGKLGLPNGVTAEGNYSSSSDLRGNDFVQCMKDERANCSWIQSPQSCTAQRLEACKGLIGSPANPQQ
jgi:hypothetical protein